MEKLNLNRMFDRVSIENEMKDILRHFDNTLKNSKKGIYIYGAPGTGKTQFVVRLLKSLDYDVISYDAGDIRNKSLFQNIDCNHVSNRNVLDLMNRRTKKIAIVMDEIDGMNNGDKGGIDALIKLIRQKKTKKQKTENTTSNPIVCIGNYESDKKLRELMKACYSFELKTPTHQQMKNVLELSLPPFKTFASEFQDTIIHYIQGDLRKLLFMCRMWEKCPHIINPETIQNIFHMKKINKDAKKITWKLFQDEIPMKEHNTFMNETDRTTVALLWHENVIQYLNKLPSEKSVPFYGKILQHICFADYIGRITFQNQIWQFNEMSSLVKTFYNNKLFHREIYPKPILPLENIEFTKVLTKYSTEYNNQIFLHGLCQKMNMDKKDIICFFQELRIQFGHLFYLCKEPMAIVEHHLGKDVVDSLDIKRMYRFLDKNVKKEELIQIDDEVSYDSDHSEGDVFF